MAELLVLSLTETTRQKNGYEVIAQNLEDGSWVIIPSLPSDLMYDNNGEVQWDIFAVTKADLRIRVYSNRSGVYDVSNDNYFPKMITNPITEYSKRIEILDKIADFSIDKINNSKEWVGLLKGPVIKDIIFKLKDNEYCINPEKTFYYECRIAFSDIYGQEITYGQKIGTACKDMRLKTYWKDVMNTKQDKMEICKEKWIKYMNSNSTYFVLEYIPNHHYGSIGMVSGIICINNCEEENNDEYL